MGKRPQGSTEKPPALSGVPMAAQPATERLRVLVVEDNKDAADSLRILLTLLGHDARVAYDGPEGVRAAADWRPDVIISDIGLPGLDGFAVAREVRRNASTAATLLVALTCYGQPEVRQNALDAGFDYFLTKPPDPAVLQKLLRSQPSGNNRPTARLRAQRAELDKQEKEVVDALKEKLKEQRQRLQQLGISLEEPAPPQADLVPPSRPPSPE